ncbi:MAG TPA: prepilin-type N-terminal cleavage/methylation domain-containing protein [Phycisphaerae bacterium]
MPRNRRFAFTLIELLVVVAIIALLIAILLPSLAKAREMTKRTVCATNMKGQGSALAIYSAQFSDQMPYLKGSVQWYRDQCYNTPDDSYVGVLTSMKLDTNTPATSIRKWFYCPSNAYDNDPGSNWAIFTDHMGLGYNFFNDRWNGATPILPLTASGVANAKATSTPRKSGASPTISYATEFGGDNASSKELAIDEIFTTTAAGTDFSGTMHGGGTNNMGTTQTSHLKGAAPAGTNVLGLDAHVEWRPWGGVAKATSFSTPGFTACYIWAIDP